MLKKYPTNFGRWKITLVNGNEVTRMGKMDAIASTLSGIKSYREIK